MFPIEEFDIEEFEPGVEEFDIEEFPVEQSATTQQVTTFPPSTAGKIWSALSEPLTTAPSEFARSVSQTLTDPNEAIMLPTGQGGFRDYMANTLAKLRGFEAGAAEGVGDLISEFTSPINLATTALTLGSGTATKLGLPQAARLLNIGSKVASLPTMAHGAQQIFDPETSLSEKGFGLAELAGGAAAFGEPLPRAKQPIRGTTVPPATSIVSEATLPRTIKLKKTPTPEELLKIKEKGYVFSHNEEGVPIWKMREKPANIPEEIESEEKPSKLLEAYNVPRAAMSIDPPLMTSAAFRQAAPLAWSKAWRNAWSEQFNIWKDAFKRAGMSDAERLANKRAYEIHKAKIEADPDFKPKFDAVFRNGKWVKKRVPSVAEAAGLQMTDVKGMSAREEVIASNWLEKIPAYGKYVKYSNEAYTTFLNETRYGQFKQMMKDAVQEAVDSNDPKLDPYKNPAVAKAIADFVNDATGRGALKQHIPGTKIDINLESSAKVLRALFFSPRNMASRMRLMNPSNYVLSNPVIRKQYTHSLMRMAGTWMGMAALAKMAGADVVMDPTNADFAKIKIGNTRFDPGAGFQQYLVLMARMALGGYTSSTSERSYEFGAGFKPETAGSTAQRFIANKLHPVAKLVYDFGFSAGQDQPIYVLDRIMQLYVPMMTSDMMEVAKENPMLALPALVFGGIGGGSQTYEGPSNEPAFIPEEFDINYEGGGPLSDWFNQ
jgi:hypothetical protein